MRALDMMMMPAQICKCVAHAYVASDVFLSCCNTAQHAQQLGTEFDQHRHIHHKLTEGITNARIDGSSIGIGHLNSVSHVTCHMSHDT